MIYIGSENPKFILYIQNKNVFLDVTQLNRTLSTNEFKESLDDSSNDWRKVCSLFSKIINGVLNKEDRWQTYLNLRLLSKDGCEQIVFGENLLIQSSEETIHIIAGKQHFEQFLFSEINWVSIGENNKLFQSGNIFYTPYFDYRQFPNVLVDELVHRIKTKVI